MGAPLLPPAVDPRTLRHVYVHVPFCASKCPYCDFNSHAGRDRESDAYVDAVLAEAQGTVAGADVDTVFVGGGTPTHLDAARLSRLLEGLRELLGTSPIQEFTVEANPGSLDRAKVRVLRRAGVNRVSLGVQSFADRHLKALGRVHDASDAVRSVALLQEGGVPRVSVDLILALPDQTLAEQERDVMRAIDLGPEHVSAYVLTYEEGTVFERMLREGRLPAPDGERELAHLHLVIDRLAAAGFGRYEISNFALPGAACAHNLAYWRDADWVGLGAGAHSHVHRARWKNVDDPADYVRRVRAEGAATEWVEQATPETALFEALMMGLRLVEGVSTADILRQTGLDPLVVHAKQLRAHREAGLLEIEGDRLRLTTEGMDLASWVVRSLLPEDVPAGGPAS